MDLTTQERRVILFLLGITLIGLCINFAVKVNSGIEKIFKIDERIFKVDINKAGYEDLLGIPGITPRLAEKIIEYRRAKTSFGKLEELKKIKGIGCYRYEKLKDLFFIE